MFKLIGIPFRDARGVHQKSIEKCTIDKQLIWPALFKTFIGDGYGII